MKFISDLFKNLNLALKNTAISFIKISYILFDDSSISSHNHSGMKAIKASRAFMLYQS